MPGTTCIDMGMPSEVVDLLTFKGKRINIIAGLSSADIVAIDIVTSTVSGQEFF